MCCWYCKRHGCIPKKNAYLWDMSFMSNLSLVERLAFLQLVWLHFSMGCSRKSGWKCIYCYFCVSFCSKLLHQGTGSRILTIFYQSIVDVNTIQEFWLYSILIKALSPHFFLLYHIPMGQVVVLSTIVFSLMCFSP